MNLVLPAENVMRAGDSLAAAKDKIQPILSPAVQVTNATEK